MMGASNSNDMCIYTKEKKPKTATEPIRCLKVVRRVHDGYVPYFWYGVTYKLGKTYKESEYGSDKLKSPLKGYHRYGIGFHSYTLNNPNAYQLMPHDHESFAILECEIPVGTRYFEGLSNTRYCVLHPLFLTETSYLSERIKVVRELTEEEIQRFGGK